MLESWIPVGCSAKFPIPQPPSTHLWPFREPASCYEWGKANPSPARIVERRNFPKLTVLGSVIVPLVVVIFFSGVFPAVRSGGFAAGTKIQMADGSLKSIESVRSGDLVLSYDVDSKKLEAEPVRSLVQGIRRESGFTKTLITTFADGSVNQDTGNHPYLVVGKGYCAGNPAVASLLYGTEVRRLQVGDLVVKVFKNTLTTTAITSIETVDVAVDTFTLVDVAKNHNYFASGLLVHNQGQSGGQTVSYSIVYSLTVTSNYSNGTSSVASPTGDSAWVNGLSGVSGRVINVSGTLLQTINNYSSGNTTGVPISTSTTSMGPVSGGGSVPIADGDYILSFNLNKNGTTLQVQYHVMQDLTPPSVQSNSDSSHFVWTNRTPDQSLSVFREILSDAVPGSGLSSVTSMALYSADGNSYSQGGTVAVQNGTYNYTVTPTKGDGYYKLQIQATDGAGNLTTYTDPGTYKYDHVAPTFAGTISLSPEGDGKTAYPSVLISWPGASDPSPGSGLAGYWVAVNGQDVAGTSEPDPIVFGGSPIPGLIQGNTCSVPLPKSRSGDQDFNVVVTTYDFAGNSSSRSLDYKLPAQVAIRADQSAKLVPNGSNALPFWNTEVVLHLNITVDQFQSHYCQLTLTRSGVSSLNRTISIQPQQVVFDTSGPWRTYSIPADQVPGTQYVEYVETIGPLMGMGGKQLTYSFTSETAIFPGASSAVSEPGAPPPTRQLSLPAHPGTMSVQILDKNGNSVKVDPAGGISGNAHALLVDETGMVNLSFQGTGIDNDEWTVDVGHVDRKQYRGSAGMATIDTYIVYDGNVGLSYPYSATTYDVKTNTYRAKVVPITLAHGVNDIKLRWVQKADSSTRYYSRIVELTFEKSLGNGYTLSLTSPGTETVDTTGTGAILTAPGQELDFDISSDIDAGLQGVGWDFGDGSSGKTGSVTHRYSQIAGQVGPTATHTIIITGLLGVSPDPQLPVVVQDTQDGPLYGSEVWNGPHIVTGNVIVPPGMTLTIGTMVAVGTSVTFAGGLAAGLDQGITVQSGASLYVGTAPGTSPAPSGASVPVGPDPNNPSATGQSWGTILVGGTAVFQGATITGADRAVTAQSGATVTLANTQLRANSIGLHVFGGSNTTATDSFFLNNAAYGMKEDKGATPGMVNNQFTGNGVDYYRDGVTLFSLSDLNAIGSNQGNHR